MSNQDKYVVVLLHDPSTADPVTSTASGGGTLLSRPMSLQSARAHAQGSRDAQPSFEGYFLVCKVAEEY